MKIKIFQSNFAGEYQKLNLYFNKNGFIHHLGCLYTHEQNGVAEHKIRHIVNSSLKIMWLGLMVLCFYYKYI